MKCPKCQFENPDDNRFFRECGPGMLVLEPGRFDIRVGGTDNLAQVIRLADT